MAGGELTPFSKGSAIVYGLNQDRVIKLFSPLYSGNWANEKRVLNFLGDRLPVATPKVVFEGCHEGWPYMIMNRLPGMPLVEVWDTLPRSVRLQLCRDAGRLLRHLHGLSIDGLDLDQPFWPQFLETRTGELEAHHRANGTGMAWIAQMTGFVAKTPWAEARPLVLLHTEFMRDHLLVARTGDGWCLTGLIDFEPSMVGDGEYDFASAALFVAGGEFGLLRAFLDGYGLAGTGMTDGLRHRIMSYILIHRYSNLDWYLSFMPGCPEAETLDELMDAWLCFEASGP